MMTGEGPVPRSLPVGRLNRLHQEGGAMDREHLAIIFSMRGGNFLSPDRSQVGLSESSQYFNEAIVGRTFRARVNSLLSFVRNWFVCTASLWN
jgi:hypothetical protein